MSIDDLVTINLVVYNGEKYIRHCLDAVKNQTYKNIEVNIFDNDSGDKTKEIAKNEFPQFKLIENNKNYGMWPGQEEALKYSHGEFIVALSVDVILDSNFVTETVRVFQKDPRIGAIQGKIYKYELSDFQPPAPDPRPPFIIDTCGFKIFKSRRVINIGHGEKDEGQYNKEMEIFAVEGAVPVFRKRALEELRILGEIVDCDFFWYGDDLDLAWRMRLFGWRQVFNPRVVAWHDRQTTKKLSKGLKDFIKMRKQIPTFKKRLDWRNYILTLIKNDFCVNIIKDLPKILTRQIALLGYFLLFEPKILLEIPTIIKLTPRVLKKRKEIMKRAKVTPEEIRKWLI